MKLQDDRTQLTDPIPLGLVIADLMEALIERETDTSETEE